MPDPSDHFLSSAPFCSTNVMDLKQSGMCSLSLFSVHLHTLQSVGLELDWVKSLAPLFTSLVSLGQVVSVL